MQRDLVGHRPRLAQPVEEVNDTSIVLMDHVLAHIERLQSRNDRPHRDEAEILEIAGRQVLDEHRVALAMDGLDGVLESGGRGMPQKIRNRRLVALEQEFEIVEIGLTQVEQRVVAETVNFTRVFDRPTRAPELKPPGPYMACLEDGLSQRPPRIVMGASAERDDALRGRLEQRQNAGNVELVAKPEQGKPDNPLLEKSRE